MGVVARLSVLVVLVLAEGVVGVPKRVLDGVEGVAVGFKGERDGRLGAGMREDIMGDGEKRLLPNLLHRWHS